MKIDYLQLQTYRSDFQKINRIVFLMLFYTFKAVMSFFSHENVRDLTGFQNL